MFSNINDCTKSNKNSNDNNSLYSKSFVLINKESIEFKKIKPKSNTFNKNISPNLNYNFNFLFNIFYLTKNHIIKDLKTPKDNLVNLFIIIFTVAVLSYSQLLFLKKEIKDNYYSNTIIDYNSNIPKCNNKDLLDTSCVTLGYAVFSQSKDIDNDIYDDLINYIAINNNLLLGKDIVKYNVSNQEELEKEIINVKQKLNHLYFVIFCHDKLIYKDYSIDCKGEYLAKNQIYYFFLKDIGHEMFINIKSELPSIVKSKDISLDYSLLIVKKNVDNAILNYFNNKKDNNINNNNNKKSNINKYIDIKFDSNPYARLALEERFNIISYIGFSLWMFISISSFLSISNYAMNEKLLLIKRNLRLINVTNTSYRLSYVLFIIITSFVSIFVFMIISYIFIFNFEVSWISAFYFFLFNYSFSLSIKTLGLFLSTIINNQSSLVIYSSTVIALSISFSFLPILKISDFILDRLSMPAKAVVVVLHILFPSFSYAMGSFRLREYIKLEGNPNKFGYEKQNIIIRNLFEEYVWNLVCTFSLGTYIILMFASCLFYYIMSWYFDNYIESNSGKENSIFFFLHINYWIKLFRCKNRNLVNQFKNNDKLNICCKNKYKNFNTLEKIIGEKYDDNKTLESNEAQKSYISKESNLFNNSLSQIFIEYNILEFLALDEFEKYFKESKADNSVFNEKEFVCKNIINIISTSNNKNKKVTNNTSNIFNKLTENNKDNITSKGLLIGGVSKKYSLNNNCCFCNKNYKYALKPIFLSVKKGEILTILGHNGCGKTTLINIITKSLAPNSGILLINNKNILEESIDGKIGLCPQFDVLWSNLTVEEHLDFYFSIINLDFNEMFKNNNNNNNNNNNKLLTITIDDIKDYYLDKVNLTAKKKTLIRHLSGGMKRRLSILLCTLSNPDLIILDEPTTGLDPINKRIIWKFLCELRKTKSLLVTTHDMLEAEYLSDRIAIMKEGNLISIGSIKELKIRYNLGLDIIFIFKSLTKQIKNDCKDHLTFVLEWIDKNSNSIEGDYLYKNNIIDLIILKIGVYFINKIFNCKSIHLLKGNRIAVDAEYNDETYKNFFKLQNLMIKNNNNNYNFSNVLQIDAITQIKLIINDEIKNENQDSILIMFSKLIYECGIEDSKMDEILYKINKSIDYKE